jgi:hypothetical protein
MELLTMIDCCFWVYFHCLHKHLDLPAPISCPCLAQFIETHSMWNFGCFLRIWASPLLHKFPCFSIFWLPILSPAPCTDPLLKPRQSSGKRENASRTICEDKKFQCSNDLFFKRFETLGGVLFHLHCSELRQTQYLWHNPERLGIGPTCHHLITCCHSGWKSLCEIKCSPWLLEGHTGFDQLWDDVHWENASSWRWHRNKSKVEIAEKLWIELMGLWPKLLFKKHSRLCLSKPEHWRGDLHLKLRVTRCIFGASWDSQYWRCLEHG